jgi:hypothetical protein
MLEKVKLECEDCGADFEGERCVCGWTPLICPACQDERAEAGTDEPTLCWCEE